MGKGARDVRHAEGHAPCGACGLKFWKMDLGWMFQESRSMRSVWIEIQISHVPGKVHAGHAPCGACGLKSVLPYGPATPELVTLHAERVD